MIEMIADCPLCRSQIDQDGNGHTQGCGLARAGTRTYIPYWNAKPLIRSRPGLQSRETELAWAAGFFDGEGSVSLHQDKRPGRKPAVRLEIEQTDIRPLMRFTAAVGGEGHLSRRAGPRAANRKVLFRVYASGASAVAIINELWPWLSEPKREQVRRVLARKLELAIVTA